MEGDGERWCHTPSQYGIDAGDKEAVLEVVGKAKTRCKLEPNAMVRSCYEAGRDGWWLHRWLIEQGIDSIVVDSASIEVNRRARRAKTDRLDGFKLLAMLLRHSGGERVWSVRRGPTAEQEDARRHDRELARLSKGAHSTRTASARSSCCTTCAHTPPSAGATGRVGGTLNVSRSLLHFAPRSNARSHG